MRKLYKPDIDTILKPLLEQGTENGKKTRGEWLAGIIPALANVLRKDPRQYMSFGPYWWLVKKCFINAGIDDFGDFIDAEWFEKATYSDPVWDIAGFAYQEFSAANGMFYSHSHLIAFVDEDGEAEEDQSVLFDEDMEDLIR